MDRQLEDKKRNRQIHAGNRQTEEAARQTDRKTENAQTRRHTADTHTYPQALHTQQTYRHSTQRHTFHSLHLIKHPRPAPLPHFVSARPTPIHTWWLPLSPPCHVSLHPFTTTSLITSPLALPASWGHLQCSTAPDMASGSHVHSVHS